MSFSFFDLHCDTATALLGRGESLTNNSLAVDLRAAKAFDRYVQVMAVFTDPSLNNEAGWQRLREVIDHLNADESVQNGTARICAQCPNAKDPVSLLLSVEDCRILNGKAERL